MALLSWPSADIMESVGIETASLTIQRQRQFSQAGSGTIYRKDMGPAFWIGNLQSVPLYHADAEQVMALLDSMEDALSSFYVWNPALAYPQADPDGSILGSSTPTIHTVNADNKRISITGLPAGYVLTRGDKVAVDYNSPSQRALYRIVDASVTADGSGVTAEFEISPRIRIGTTAGNTVHLVKPAANMMIVPGSLSCQTDSGTTSRINFQTIEVP